MPICVYDIANEAEIPKAKITQIATAEYRRIAYRVCQRYESFAKECKTADLCKVCEADKVWCNGRGEPAPLRKARGIVRFWEGQAGHGCLKVWAHRVLHDAKPYKRTQTRPYEKRVMLVQSFFDKQS